MLGREGTVIDGKDGSDGSDVGSFGPRGAGDKKASDAAKAGMLDV